MFIFCIILHYNIGLYFKYVPVLIVSILTFFVQIGPESFPNLISSEIFPNNARSYGKGILRSISSIFSFIVLSLFPTLKEAIGLQNSFLLLGSILLSTLPLTYFFLPEAKNVDLNCIGRFYEPQGTHFYHENNTADDIRKNRIHMICNSFGWFRRCICEGNPILLAEGVITVTEMHGNNVSTGKRLVCVLKDKVIIGTIVTSGILFRNMKVLECSQLILTHSSEYEFSLTHLDELYCFNFDSEIEKERWQSLFHITTVTE